jgi:SNF2 family DNA or RNA helicase
MYLKTKPDKLGNPVVPGMKVSLMQHQLIGVKWMCERENEPALGRKNKNDDEAKKKSYGKVKTVATVGGGLLADEMGLGKTIQSIALMIHNKPQRDDPVKVFPTKKSTLM